MDPYYLTTKQHGFYSEVILAGLKTNDTKVQYVAVKLRQNEEDKEETKGLVLV